jgi:hypothetical protein
MNLIELHFPIQGATLPTDHGYTLYAALCRHVPALHAADCPMLIATIGGQSVGPKLIRLDPDRSRLRFRLPADQIPALLKLAGKALELDGHRLRLGVPNVRALIPAPSLIARLVVLKASSPRTVPADRHSRDRERTKRYLNPATFLDGCRHQLDELGVAGEVGIPLVHTGPHQEKPRRHVLRVRDKKVVGFSVQINGLTAEESLKVQEHGLGGRKKMGCGFFVAMLEGGPQ